ncbi:MAG: alpha/beta fold hydrolase, partial [Polyangiales bacterium]
ARPADDTAVGADDTSPPASDTAAETPPWSAELVRPALACADRGDDVYVTPATLPAFTKDARGDVVRCATDATLDRAATKKSLGAAGINDVEPTSGVKIFRIAYRTERGDGDAGVGTARIYLPDTPRKGPLPMVVVAHPSEGLADGCAPSRDENKLRDLALPWAARGLVVIAPDLAGLGNEGVQGYQDNRDSGQSTLDAARALRKLLKVGALDDRIVMVGYSQGGGAVLSAQALERTYGSGGRMVGVVTFAAQWATSPASFGLLGMLKDPEALTIGAGITKPVVATLMAYAYRANWLSTGAPADAFPAAKRADIESALSSKCLIEYGGWIQGISPKIKDLLDEPLRASIVACSESTTSAGCVEPGKSYHAFLQSNVVHADPAGAKILYIQGLLDQIMPPAEEAACNLAVLAKDGVTPQVCTDVGATHATVLARKLDVAMQWTDALLSGDKLPTCSSGGMPACNR